MLTIRKDLFFNFVDNWFTGFKNVLIVIESRLSMLLIKKIKIGFTEGLFRIIKPEFVRTGLVDADKAVLVVFEKML